MFFTVYRQLHALWTATDDVTCTTGFYEDVRTYLNGFCGAHILVVNLLIRSKEKYREV